MGCRNCRAHGCAGWRSCSVWGRRSLRGSRACCAWSQAAAAGARGVPAAPAASGGAAAVGEERLAQAYSVLEASPGMSDDQIVKAYRRQMSRHHPDKLKANGLPDSMLERAKERTQQIQAAYEAIRARRGMR